MKLQDKDLALLQSLQNALFGTDAPVPINDALINEAIQQKVLLFVDMSAQYALPTMMHNMKVYHAHAALEKLLSDLPHVFIKGYASAAYYPNPSLRNAGDVDFLLDTEDVERAKSILLENGFAEIEDTAAHHLCFQKDGVKYELHTEINGIPAGAIGTIVKKYLSNLIATATRISTPYGEITVPDEFHHGLTILLHTARHLLYSGIGLRHLSDWAVFVDRQEDFPALFESTLREVGLWTFACQLTAVCSRYLGLCEQPWAGAWDEPFLEDFMQEIIHSGNLGSKRQETREGWFTSEAEAGGLSQRNPVLQFVHNVNYRTIERWPAAKRCKILLPIGFVWFCLKSLGRILIGKRKLIHPGAFASEVKRRSALHAQFRLFDA